MTAEKTAKIRCPKCYQKFEVTANDVKIRLRHTGKIPRTELYAHCPRCGLIHPRMTPELSKILDDRTVDQFYPRESFKPFGLL